MNHTLKINWRQQPWTKMSNAEIADKLGNCSVHTVRVKRKFYAPKTIKSRPVKFDFTQGIDWDLSNDVIARKLGCSASLVAVQRKLLKQPFAPRRQRGGKTRRIDVSKYNPNKTADENARKLGCSVNYVTKIKKLWAASRQQELAVTGLDDIL